MLHMFSDGRSSAAQRPERREHARHLVAPAAPHVAVGGDVADLNQRERRAVALQHDLVGTADADPLHLHAA